MPPLPNLGRRVAHAMDQKRRHRRICCRQSLAQVEANYGAARDFINQLLGRAQMADAFRKFSTTVVTSQLATVKESKSYKSMSGMKIPDVGTLTGTWEEFCNLLGLSVSKVDEDINHLRIFGEEAQERAVRSQIMRRRMILQARSKRSTSSVFPHSAESQAGYANEIKWMPRCHHREIPHGAEK